MKRLFARASPTSALLRQRAGRVHDRRRRIVERLSLGDVDRTGEVRRWRTAAERASSSEAEEPSFGARGDTKVGATMHALARQALERPKPDLFAARRYVKLARRAGWLAFPYLENVAACGIAQFGRAIICNRGHDRCAMSNDRVTQPDGNVQARLAVPCAVRCDVPAHEGAGARQGEAAGFQMRVPHRPRVNHVRPDFERDRHVG